MALLDRAGRSRRAAPIDKRFLQQGTESIRKPGPLAALVRHHADRALELFLLGHAVASAPPYDVTEAADVWARTLDLGRTDSSRTKVSKTFARLDTTHHLMERTREGRRLRVTLLAADGSGDPYEPPGSDPEGRYLTLPFAYWEQGWHRKLTLPGKAFLLIGLSLLDGFNLPSNKGRTGTGCPRTRSRRVPPTSSSTTSFASSVRPRRHLWRRRGTRSRTATPCSRHSVPGAWRPRALLVQPT